MLHFWKQINSISILYKKTNRQFPLAFPTKIRPNAASRSSSPINWQSPSTRFIASIVIDWWYRVGRVSWTKKLALILARSTYIDTLIPVYVCVHPGTRRSTRIRLYPDKRRQSVLVWFNVNPLICTSYLLSGRLDRAESVVRPVRKFDGAIHYGLCGVANQRKRKTVQSVSNNRVYLIIVGEIFQVLKYSYY